MRDIIILSVVLVLAVLGCTQPSVQQPVDQNLPADQNVSDSNAATDQNTVDVSPDQNNAIEGRKDATLRVYAKSEDGNWLAGASVLAESVTEGFSDNRSGTTDENGFALFSLKEASYKVIVEKEGYVSVNVEKLVEAGLVNEVNVGLGIAQQQPTQDSNASDGTRIKWKQTLNDGNISIGPEGFLNVARGERRLVLEIKPDIIGDPANKTFEWRVKIIEGSSTGFAMTFELPSPAKELIKVQHSTDRVNVVGSDIAKVNVDLKKDYHTFKFVVDAERKASLYLDGEMKVSGKSFSSALPYVDPTRLFFESYKGITSIDYFYIDIDNDGQWDYREEWNSLDDVNS